MGLLRKKCFAFIVDKSIKNRSKILLKTKKIDF